MFLVVLVVAVAVVPGNPVTAWFAATIRTPSGWWSLATMAASVTGLWLAGYNPRWGWWAGLPTQVVWAVAGVALARPGDIILSAVFTVLYARNLWRTRGQTMSATREIDSLRAQHAELLAANAALRETADRLRELQHRCCPQPGAGTGPVVAGR
jgi:hypothetical protein